MSSIKGKVAVLGVGCTDFGDRFAESSTDLLREASLAAIADAGIDKDDVQAGWLGAYFPHSGLAGTALSDAIGLSARPVTRIENYCVTGTDTIRNAAFAVASGMYDVVVAAGVEKLKERGDVGIPDQGEHHVIARGRSAPGGFALSATAYLAHHGLGTDVLDHVAVKNHDNGADHPRAHLRRRITLEEAAAAPMVSSPLRLFDCCPTSDGAAAVVLARPEIARELSRPVVTIRGIGVASFRADPYLTPGFDYLHWPATRAAAADAYAQAGLAPGDVDVAEVHDCFTITELLTVEDLGLVPDGEGWRATLEGETAIDGRVPVNPSGGLKAFGHPVAASGVRMVVEVTRQLQGRAEGRQVRDAEVGVAHNVGGPGGAIAGVTLLARS